MPPACTDLGSDALGPACFTVAQGDLVVEVADDALRDLYQRRIRSRVAGSNVRAGRRAVRADGPLAALSPRHAQPLRRSRAAKRLPR